MMHVWSQGQGDGSTINCDLGHRRQNSLWWWWRRWGRKVRFCLGHIVLEVPKESLSNLFKELPVKTELGLGGMVMVTCVGHLALHLLSGGYQD